jgi:PHD/YefM family antitoxin component YafN of YafNO toxin-antitoxin module
MKLDEATKLIAELMETIEVLRDEGMMRAIREGQEDIKAGRVKELRCVLKEEAH